MKFNIAIDGTAGSGKGTISKIIANKLGIYHLDTGAIYRSITYFLVKNKINLEDENQVTKNLKKINLDISFKPLKNNYIQINKVNGVNLLNKIRTENISLLTSIVSKYPKVRKLAIKIQRKLAKNYNLVMEGRDIGTVVLPKAKYKFFLTAKPEIRAYRRLKQLNLSESKFFEVLKDIKIRDENDVNRKISPLKVAKNAIFIDNSDLSIEDTVKKILSYIINEKITH